MLNLVIATTNKGKIKEFRNLLKDLPVNLLGLDDFAYISEVEETGKTFAENAELKAKYYALKTNCWTLADDSGLEVESLNNAPGVYSARYAGEKASDAENITKLLRELENTLDIRRLARFVCEMTISNEMGEIKFTAKGVCKGKISLKPLGNNGFGYDPIFIPDNFSETFGELSDEIKQQISHRSKATQEIIRYFKNIVIS